MDSLSNGIDSSLYVDDLLICYSSDHMEGTERKLQLTLNRVEKWANTNGFKFSESKTVAMHFCQKRALHPDPELSIYGNRIPVVNQTKFLGLTFDNKLTFKPHIHLLKTKCQRALNILKVVSNHHWGADRDTLLLLYRSLVRSKLDYGCIVYGSARKSYTDLLDPVHNQALRICLGAFRTSPAESLCVEAMEAPLAFRREKLTLQYITRIKANPHNPVSDAVFHPKFVDLFQARPNAIPTLGIRIIPHINRLPIDINHVSIVRSTSCPRGSYHFPKSILIFLSFRKTKPPLLSLRHI